jgi:hypothetical protein
MEAVRGLAQGDLRKLVNRIMVLWHRPTAKPRRHADMSR